MNKILSAVVLVAGLLAMPSFAQFGEASSMEPQSFEGVHRRPGPPPPPPSAGPSFGSDQPKLFRLGGRIAVGFGSAGDWAGFNGDLGSSLRLYFNQFVAAAPEINFAFRNFSQTDYSYTDSYDYTHHYDRNFNQILLTVPLLGRFEPVPFIYAESGLQLGITLWSGYSYDEVLSDDWGEEDDRSRSLDEADWDCSDFYASFVLGAGATVKTHRGQDVDVGIRFVFDLNELDQDGDHAWSIQLSMTYLL